MTTEKPDLAKTNFAGLDAVRAGAAIAVVALHALVPYLRHPMPGLVWSVSDTGSSFADALYWSIELFVMPLFLVMAGFLAFGTYQRKGAKVLTTGRAKRLLRPLAFAVVVILPLDLYTWVLGWVSEGLVSPVKLKSLKFDGAQDRHLWGLSHLWFLHYLFSYVALFAVATVVYAKSTFARRFTVSLPMTILLSWVVATAVILIRPEVIWGFQHDFAPVPSKWIYNGCFFMIGLAIAAFDPDAIRWRSVSPKWAIASACLIAATVPLGLWSLESASDQTRTSHAALAMLTASSSLAASITIVALALRYIRQIPTAVQYLAAASFWIYLVHHPILALIHIDLKWLMPETWPMVKAMIATNVAIALSVISFECLVRRSSLGNWLGMNWALPITDHAEANQDADSHVLSMPERSARQTPSRRAA